MKKLILALLSIFIIGMLTACQSISTLANAGTTTNTEIAQHTDSTDTFVSPNRLFFTDIESYNKYVSETELPDSFVTAEELACFGTFVGFCSVSDFYNEDYSYYHYSFIDPNGVDLMIVIKNTPYDDSIELNALTVSSNMTDMRNLNKAQSGIITHNNISYLYSSVSNLYSIRFSIDGVYFKLECSGGFGKYPTNKQETVITRLLSITTEKATGAIADIQAAISNTESKS